jgi:hypothetical protein
MPPYRAPKLLLKAPTGEEFNLGNALSFTTQPYLREMLECLSDSTTNVTFIVGAGVSIDAGLPSWDDLLIRVADHIQDDRLRALALEDDKDSQLRRAESMFRRECLYRGVDGETEPGPLARAIAKIAATMNNRCSLITTNFDDVLEVALHNETGVEPEAFSLYPERGGEEDKHRGDLAGEAWRRARETRGALAVMHLHGMARRRLEPLKPLILTESHFLRHGPHARDVVLEELEKRVVIFIGVSLNDPNLVGPLWDRAHQEPVLADIPPCFVLHVPSFIEGAIDIHEARAFGLAKYEYMESALGVRPIFLKSYSQLYQAMVEVALCTSSPQAYLSNEGESISYGSRFSRIVSRCHKRAANTEDDFIARAEFSRALREMLTTEHAIGNLLAKPTSAVKRELDTLRRLYSDTSHGDPPERFGLFVWLRSLPQARGEPAPYSLELVGSSTYVHFETWSSRRRTEIQPRSPFTAAESVFSGTAIVGDSPVSGPFRIWRGSLAVPIRVSSTPERNDVVTVGAIVLNTTYAIAPDDDTEGPVSVLAALARMSEESANLVQLLDDCASKLLMDDPQ